MKKFISMVMAAAMVVTMVPATAFAANNTISAKVVDGVEITGIQAKEDLTVNTYGIPELQLKITNIDSRLTDTDDVFDVTLTLKGIEGVVDETLTGEVYSKNDSAITAGVTVEGTFVDKDEVEVTVTETSYNLQDGDIIYIPLEVDGLKLTKDKVGHVGTVKVSGDLGSADAMTVAAVVEKGIKAELDEDTADVAVEEITQIDPIVIKVTAGDFFTDVLTFKEDEDLGADEYAKLSLKLSKGFEWVGNSVTVEGDNSEEATWTEGWDLDIDGDEITIILTDGGFAAENGKMILSGLEVEATTADAGDVATVTVKASGVDAVKVADVAKVIDYKVVMTLVDEDEDVPVFYNGVDSENTGLTVDDNHEALAVNISETFKGAWSNHKEFKLSLPAGVHVVNVVDTDGNFEGGVAQVDDLDDTASLMWAAYQEGDHEEFVFEKRVFEETDPDDETEDELEMEFTLVLTADPDFVGDVVLTLEGAAVDTQEVTIAKFVAPYTVKAEQNDVIIDYRYTEVPTSIVITEAEAGLWADGLKVEFAMEEMASMIAFEDDATVTVNEESGMEIDDELNDDNLGFEVTEESEEEPAVITISDIELFMQRNIPAGPYALEVGSNTATEAFEMEGLWAPDKHTAFDADHEDDCDGECFVQDVADYSTTVHEAFINVVTAGRDQDDASFTTKVVVPVGESYIVAGDKQIALDVPAYINADGYTMLPVRAVATALGINNDAVQWNQATKTVIIMYGQRIITMTAGQNVVYVSGTAIPAASSVEIVNGRAFLGLRDLATTLGVAKINWDPATKVASLN